jgi:predicted transcriptional regulator
MKTVVVWSRLSPELAERLDRLCAEVQRERSEVLRALVTSATLDSLPGAWRGAEAARLLAIER